MTYGRLPTRLLFDERELGRIDQPVVAEGVVVNEALLHVLDVVLDDPRRDVLADHADRHRRRLVDVDDLLEVGVALRLVWLGAALLPEIPDLANRMILGRLFLLPGVLVVPMAVGRRPRAVVDRPEPAPGVGLD